MGDTGPLPVNQVATIIDTIIKGGEDAALASAEALIIGDAPLMATPVLKQIWQAVLKYFAGYIFKALELGSTDIVIDIQVGKEQRAVSGALAALIAAEKTGDKDAIQKAIKVYADANSALIHYDGSATPQ